MRGVAMTRRRRSKRSPSRSFVEASEYVESVMGAIISALDREGIQEYEESDNESEIIIPCESTDRADRITDIIKSNGTVPEKAICCLIDINYSAVSSRVFIRLKRK